MIGSRQGDVHALQVRGDLRGSYRDVFTPEAIAALAALAPLDAPRRALMAARIERRARRARDRQRIAFLDPAATIPGTDITVQDARAGKFIGSEIPADLQRQWIQGTGPARQAERAGREEHPQRRLRAALRRRRLDVRRRGRARPGLDDVARQPAQPQAGHPQRSRVHEGRRAGGRRDEQVGAGLLRAPDHRRLEEAARLHDQDLPRARAAPRRPARPPWPTARASPRRSSTRCSTSSTTSGGCGESGSSLVLYLPKIQTAEEAALWNDILSALEHHLALAAGAIKVYVLVEQVEACFQLMEIRAALGQALRRLQHRPLGLHQQRLRRDGLGSRVRQSEHRRRSR